MARAIVGQPYAAMVEANFEVMAKGATEWMIRCPWHEDGSASLQFNVERGLWLCFSCGRKGRAEALFGPGFHEPEPDLDTIIAKLDDLEAERPNTLPVLRESALRRYRFPTDHWTEDRGLDAKIIKAFDLGYDPINEHAIIPFRNLRGKLLGFIRRDLNYDRDDPDHNRKYNYPRKFPRRTSFFGDWLVAKSMNPTAVLVEGPMDAIKVWQAGYQGLAQYGSAITNEQVRLINRLGITDVVLMFDHDGNKPRPDGRELGGVMATRVACEQLRDVRIKVVQWPDTNRKMDPGGLSTSRIRSYVDGALQIS